MGGIIFLNVPLIDKALMTLMLLMAGVTRQGLSLALSLPRS